MCGGRLVEILEDPQEVVKWAIGYLNKIVNGLEVLQQRQVQLAVVQRLVVLKARLTQGPEHQLP
jgi:hypothetical protein